MNKGQSGQATLLGLLVIAMSSAVVALQMRTIEQQSIEEQLDRRANDARTYGMLGMARVQDLFGSGYLVQHCERGRQVVMVNPALEAEKHRAISRIWDTGAQAAQFQYCDYEALTVSDRSSLYAPSGDDAKNCKKVPVVVTVPNGTCGKPLVATATANVTKKELLLGTARTGAHLLAELSGGSTKKGCPFACHTGPDGKKKREKAAAP